MQSNQRVLLAVLLSFLVLWGYTLLVPPPKKPSGRARALLRRAGRVRLTPHMRPRRLPTRQSASAGTALPPAAATTPATPAAAATVADTAEHDVVVDTKLVHAVFSNRGGVLTVGR